MPVGIRNNAINSLIVLSEFLGMHKEFKRKLDDYGVKRSKQDVFASFMRIYNDNASDLIKWCKEAFAVLRANEQTFLGFLVSSGLRKEEEIIPFNKILELSRENNMGQYYNEESNVL